MVIFGIFEKSRDTPKAVLWHRKVSLMLKNLWNICVSNNTNVLGITNWQKESKRIELSLPTRIMYFHQDYLQFWQNSHQSRARSRQEFFMKLSRLDCSIQNPNRLELCINLEEDMKNTSRKSYKKINFQVHQLKIIHLMNSQFPIKNRKPCMHSLGLVELIIILHFTLFFWFL